MWNDDWRNELKEKNHKVWERLCGCRNTKNDIKIMSRLVNMNKMFIQHSKEVIITEAPKGVMQLDSYGYYNSVGL